MTWRRGVIESAIIRRRWRHEIFDLAQFRLLVQSRVGQFIRHLTVDAGRPELADGFAALEELPPTLETLQLGYRLAPVLRAHPPSLALKQRCPRLRDAPVFYDTPGVKLRGEQQTLAVVAASRLVRGPNGNLEFSDNSRARTLAAFFIDDANIWLTPEHGTELNEREVTTPVRLMLGDELWLRKGERFLVEPNDVPGSRYQPASPPTGDDREFGGAL